MTAMRKLRYLGRLLRDVWGFAAENKAWWMVPLFVVLGLLALLIVVGEASAPFIYTLW